MIVLSLAEFSARRRDAQTRVEDALRPLTREALDGTTNTHGWDDLLDEVAHQWRLVYEEESGASGPGMPTALRDEIRDALRHTDRSGASEATVERIAVWLATAVLSHATLTASDDDPEELFVEWVDMGDTKVRPAHQRAAGQQRPIGERFDVDGTKMRFPGDPSVPIELWINCRCTLRPVLASEVNSMTASTFAPEEKDGIPAMPGEDSRAEVPTCTCCGGSGEHSCGHECYACDAAMTLEAQAESSEPICPGHHGVPDPHKDDYGPDFEHDRDPAYPDEIPPGTPQKIDPEGKFADIPRMFAWEKVEPLEEPTHAGFAVYAADTGRILMIQRSLDPEDPPEVQGTWEFPGGKIDEGETPEEAARREFCEETGLAVPDGEVTNGWRSPDGVYQGFVYTVPVEADAFEEINPDLAAAEMVNPDDPERRNPDVSAWFTIEQITNLGPALRPEVAKTDWSIFGQQEEDQMADPEIDEIEKGGDPNEAPPIEMIAVPWHGVLTVEGKPSGDGRGFKPGALTTRPLPLPLTWQKTSAEGHLQNVTVAKIEQVVMVDGEQRACGHFLTIPEADEALGLIADFGRFGVSVDADDASFEFDEDSEVLWFDKARTAGACIVPIPAFHEAWVALGEAPEGFMDGEAREVEGDEPEVLVASSAFWQQFVDVAPGVTEDGPGWLTHPVDTDRLRDYWTHGEGAAKIAWGVPGDFDRCRANLAEYVKPQYLNGYCANRHKDALGVWPGQEASARDALEATDMSESVSLVAAGGRIAPVPDTAPAAWFKDPQFTVDDGRLVEQPNGGYGCPLTITKEGQVYGHIATWRECHDSFTQRGQCVIAPHSMRGYADFMLGAVLTEEGEIPVGSLTIGSGHAGDRLSAAQARAHYDNACAVFADVAVGEDKHGIWCAGWVRPGTPPEMVHAARASKISGDWRKIGANLELVAALAVNVPGYRVPRISAAVQGGQMVSLVACGAVVAESEVESSSVDIGALAAAVVDEIDARVQRQARAAALKSKAEVFAPALTEALERSAAARRQRIDALAARLKEVQV